MELDILKTNTTWNDASASINNNFEKVRLALQNGGGAKVYNVYAYDTLSDEQKSANKAAYDAVTKEERAIFYIWHEELIAPMLSIFSMSLYEQAVFGSTATSPNEASIVSESVGAGVASDGSISFRQYIKEEAPTAAKVEEMIAAGGTGSGGGLELRELKASGSAEDNAYNLETLELIEQRKAISFVNLSEYEVLYPIMYIGDRTFFGQVLVGDEALNVTFSIDEHGAISSPKTSVNAPLILRNKEDVKKWLRKATIAATLGTYEPAYVLYEFQLCLADYYQASGNTTTRIIQFNRGSQRFERVYDVTTGEEISTTEIPIGGGGGAQIAVDDKLSSISENPVQNKVIYAELIERFDGIDALLDAINGEEI